MSYILSLLTSCILFLGSAPINGVNAPLSCHIAPINAPIPTNNLGNITNSFGAPSPIFTVLVLVAESIPDDKLDLALSVSFKQETVGEYTLLYFEGSREALNDLYLELYGYAMGSVL